MSSFKISANLTTPTSETTRTESVDLTDLEQQKAEKRMGIAVLHAVRSVCEAGRFDVTVVLYEALSTHVRGFETHDLAGDLRNSLEQFLATRVGEE